LGAAKTVFFRNINDVVATVDKAETKWMKEKFQALVIRQLVVNAWTVFYEEGGVPRKPTTADFSSALKYWMTYKGSNQWSGRAWKEGWMEGRRSPQGNTPQG